MTEEEIMEQASMLMLILPSEKVVKVAILFFMFYFSTLTLSVAQQPALLQLFLVSLILGFSY